MNKPLTTELFAEDKAHEALLSSLIKRVALEEGVSVAISVRSALGGHGRALSEYDLFQLAIEKGHLPSPDLIVACIDANCLRYNQARKQVEKGTHERWRSRVVIACPDPHVERWYMADPEGFAEVVGLTPRIRKGKCERAYYKTRLSRTIREAGQLAPLGGIEFAPDLVKAMDIFRAGKNDKSLWAFVGDLRETIRRLASGA